MVETTTQNYGWTKPEVTKSASTWGGFLNGDLDSIDALVFANQQGIVPIGAIQMFGGAAAPTNWLICDGASLDRTTYAALFAVMSTRFGAVDAGHFNLPDLRNRFPIGAGATAVLGAGGGAATVTLDTTMIPAHTHLATQAPHTHPTSFQDAHIHSVTQTAHTHAITTGSHAHGANLMRLVGSGGTLGVAGGANVANGGNTDNVGNIGGTTDSQAPAISIDARQPVVHIDTQQPPITVNLSTGGGAAHNNLPPYVGINFIIRAI